MVGIDYLQTKQCALQFADNLNAIADGPNAVQHVIEIVQEFGGSSGCSINVQKSVVYPVSRNALPWRNDFPLRISYEPMKVLGVWISTDGPQWDINKSVAMIKQELLKFRNFHLSLFGKVTIVNTFVASKLIYPMFTCTAIPAQIVSEFNNAVKHLLWGEGKKQKIPLAICHLPVRQGGLNLVNIEHRDTAVKASWIPRMIVSQRFATYLENLFGSKGSILPLAN